jgi:hypothetical protein
MRPEMISLRCRGVLCFYCGNPVHIAIFIGSADGQRDIWMPGLVFPCCTRIRLCPGLVSQGTGFDAGHHGIFGASVLTALWGSKHERMERTDEHS